MKKNSVHAARRLYGILSKQTIRVMKLTILLLLLTIFQLYANDTYSQMTKITLKLENEKISDVLKKIEDQSEFYFLYSPKLIDVEKRVSINAKKEPINNILSTIFEKSVKFEVYDRQIILSPIDGWGISASPQQKQTITGTVKDENGNTLPGVSILIKGTNRGTATGVDGKFTLDLPTQEAVIVVSIIGFQTKEIRVTADAKLEIVLVSTSQALDEVVVVGYGTQKKVDLTGSVASISSKELLRGQPTTIEQALKGKMAGVEVRNTDGAPGGGITIKIRGANSITAGNSPLYVIDGFPSPISDDPFNNPLSKLSPESVESITILKDVSSTAIYGAQGANGVVLITTKKAKAGFSEFSFKASVGFNKLSKSLEMMTNEEYMKSMMQAAVMDQRWENTDFYQDYKNQIWKTDPSRFQSYQDLCMRTGVQKRYDLAYSGGTSVIRNMTVFSLLDQEGVVINNGYKDYNLMSNTTVQLLPRLSIDANLQYNHNTIDGIGYINSIATFSPLIPKEWTFQEIDDNLYYTGKMDNPYRLLMDTDQKRIKSQFSLLTEIKWDIFDGLTFKGGVGIRKMGENFKKYVPPTLLSSFNNEGEAQSGKIDGTNMRYTAQLFYTKIINKIHEVSFGLVGEANSYETESFNQAYTHFNTDLGWYGIQSAKSGTFVTPPTLLYDRNRMESGVVMGNYSLKNRYLLKASLRADGSSKFGPENRWGYFPSGALGWRISEEEFFKSSFLSKFMDNMKLRISAGSVGNDQIDNYIFINSLAVNSRRGVFINSGSPASNGTYGSLSSTTILANYTSKMSNKAIAWEKTSEINFGLDLGLFKSRINMTIDYYIRETSNMLLNKALPMVSGFDRVTRNIGSVGNKGIEFSIFGRIIESKDFSWDASFNISANRSKVLDLGGVNLMIQSRGVGNCSASENVVIMMGKPLGLLYGLQMEGIRSTWSSDNNAPNSVYWYNTQREGVYGFPSFADINGDGTVDRNDKTIIGCVQPTYIGGFNQRFTYKFIDLSMDLNWSKGNDIINGNYYYLSSVGGIGNKLRVYSKAAWFAQNNGTIPGAGGGSWSGMGKNEASPSEIVEDGSYLKMNNISLGVTLPKSLTPHKSIKAIKLSYNITNLFTLTRYSGYDPEVSSGSNIDNRILSGVDLSAFPYSRTHQLTLNINF
jgi:TonB-dependent starch-binding outer membrane protein SusC